MQPGHLSDGQIEDCARTSPGGGPREIEAHLSDCEFCLGRLLQLQRTQLTSLERKGMKPDPYPECPYDTVLQEVAAEIAAPETAIHVLQHAAQCDHCGPLLNRYLQEFSEELSPEIEAVIQQLPITQPKWQREKARAIVGNSLKPKERVSFWGQIGDWWAATKPWAIAAVAAALVVGTGIVRGPAIVEWVEINNENQRVAAAYAQGRTIEPRFTGVDSGPYQKPAITLGPEDQSEELNRPAFLEAWNKLSHKLTSGGKLDPRWLQIKGRLLLLKDPGSAKTAEETFQQAQLGGLKDHSLEIDLAVSYFELESKTDKPNLSKTIDQLRKVLESDSPKPNREEQAVALFDLALAYEKTKAWDLALATWQEYLKTDPSGPWAEEARKHLAEARSRVSKQQSYKAPADFIRHSADPEVRNDVEQYQEFALGRWLPSAIGDPLSDSGLAVRKVADLLEQEHSDTMWVDLVNSSRKAELPAVQALSAAFLANQNDQHHEAVLKSREAARIFGKHHNTPGEMLARFQEIYALQRSLAGDDCLREVNQLWLRVFTTRYRWLQGELALERATCANLVFKFRTSEINVETSRALASEANFNFPELRLRITGLDAGMKRLNFEHDAAWTEAVGGLDDYWKHAYSSERLYQFYTVMRLSATETSSFHTAEALLRRSIEILQDNAPDNNVLKALLHMRLASLLWEQDQESLAEAEAACALVLLKQIPPSEPAVQTYAALARIELADFDLRRHQTKAALDAIQPIDETLPLQDSFVKLDFYRVRGDAKLQLSQFDDAAADYRNAIRVAERPFFNLRDDDGKYLRWITVADKIYRGMVQVLLARGQPENALALWEWSKDRFLKHRAWDVDSRDVLRKSSKLRIPPVALPHVVYVSFVDRLQVWIVQGTQIQSQSIQLKQSELLKLVREFDDICKDPKSSKKEVESRATNLYGLILQPVMEALASPETIAIEFDDLIPYFAIEALKSPKGRYFGADYAVLRSPGILAESNLRRPVPLKPLDPFLVVDASPANGSGFLPGHQLPTEAIVRIHPQARIFTGEDLSLQKVRQTLRNSVALQFTGHGRRGGKGIALELGPDLYLRSKDFSPELLRRLGLVVLAACSSGSAENGLVDADNLVRSLLAGQVPSIIASHWNVDSQSTGELFGSFYLNLSRGGTAAQALRDARKELSTRPEWAHPYYWAAFNLTGRSN